MLPTTHTKNTTNRNSVIVDRNSRRFRPANIKFDNQLRNKIVVCRYIWMLGLTQVKHGITHNFER